MVENTTHLTCMYVYQSQDNGKVLLSGCSTDDDKWVVERVLRALA